MDAVDGGAVESNNKALQQIIAISNTSIKVASHMSAHIIRHVLIAVYYGELWAIITSRHMEY